MPLFTLTINNLNPARDHKNAEVTDIGRFLDYAKHDVVSQTGLQTSGNILDYNNVVVGNWVYTPQAAS